MNPAMVPVVIDVLAKLITAALDLIQRMRAKGDVTQAEIDAVLVQLQADLTATKSAFEAAMEAASPK